MSGSWEAVRAVLHQRGYHCDDPDAQTDVAKAVCVAIKTGYELGDNRMEVITELVARLQRLIPATKQRLRVSTEMLDAWDHAESLGEADTSLFAGLIFRGVTVDAAKAQVHGDG